MNLHFELDGLDWNGSKSQALTPNMDLFPNGGEDMPEYANVFERAAQALPALLENAYATLWVHVGECDLLIYSVAEVGHQFPVDQANAGVDVVLISGEEIVKRDQSVGLETAARALFDLTMYASTNGLPPRDSVDDPESIRSDPLSVVITDRRWARKFFECDLETLHTIQSLKARWVVLNNNSINPSLRDLGVFPGPYWHPRDDQYTDSVTKDETERVLGELEEHCGREPSLSELEAPSS